MRMRVWFCPISLQRDRFEPVDTMDGGIRNDAAMGIEMRYICNDDTFLSFAEGGSEGHSSTMNVKSKLSDNNVADMGDELQEEHEPQAPQAIHQQQQQAMQQQQAQQSRHVKGAKPIRQWNQCMGSFNLVRVCVCVYGYIHICVYTCMSTFISFRQTSEV
jgi:hypothetical protein